MRRIREWFSVALTNHTRAFIALMIVLLNVLFVFVGGVLLFYASRGLYESIPDAIFGTVKMILDAGFMRETHNHNQTALSVAIIIIGMIIFSGATMGYLVAFIFNLISEAESGHKRLHISNHIVILNWNIRASEILNELLYTRHKEQVVVLVNKDREAVQREIEARLSASLQTYRRGSPICADEKKDARICNRPTVIVREGDIFSATELNDISLPLAKTVILLGRDTKNVREDNTRYAQQGNVLTVKTLIQIISTLSHSPFDIRPKVIVEVDDEWTEQLTTIVARRAARLPIDHMPEICIIPVFRTLGEILTLFSIMPILNRVYSELFSNRGATFFTCLIPEGSEFSLLKMLSTHPSALPLGCTQDMGLRSLVYMANEEASIWRTCAAMPKGQTVRLNPDYIIPYTNIIIIGHNSNYKAIQDSYDAFWNEWRTPENDPVHLCILDDEDHIGLWENREYITKYPTHSIYDKETVINLLRHALEKHAQKQSILILSDDELPPEAYDSYVLTYLIYVRELVDSLPASERAIDIVVEIMDPRHYYVVKSYSVDNIVISNRYVSRILLQCGEKEMLYQFYQDVLTYDDLSQCANSKEIYIKRAKDYYVGLPPRMTAAELVQSTFAASPPNNPNVLLGIVDTKGCIRLFSGDRRNTTVQLKEQDQVIVYSCH